LAVELSQTQHDLLTELRHQHWAESKARAEVDRLTLAAKEAGISAGVLSQVLGIKPSAVNSRIYQLRQQTPSLFE